MAQGANGVVTFDGVFVTIARTGLARMTVGKGDKRIPPGSISGVEWKPAGAMVNGFIQFTIPGGNERRSSVGSRTFDAAKDENSVVFTRKQQPAFEQLREAVEMAIAQRWAPQPAIVQSQPSAADELAKLAQLVQQGLVSRDEFERAKSRLLGL